MNVHLINLQIMAEVLAATHMLAWFLEHREGYPMRAVLSSLLCLVAAVIFPMPESVPVMVWGLIVYISLFVASMAGIAACYQEPLGGILCCTISGYTIHQAASAMRDMLDSILKILHWPVPSLFVWLAALLVSYWVGFLMMSPGIRKHGHIRIDNRMLPILSLAVLLVDILTGLFVFVLSAQHDMPEYKSLVQFMDLLACGFILMLQRELFSNHSLELQLQIVSQMLQEEKRQYEQSRSNIAMINQKCHDLKHQIREVRRSGSQVDSAVLREIEDAVRIYDTSVQTGCAALDVILTEKMLLCESKGIPLTCMANGSGLKDVPAPDIYALFGNILDNAIDAVSQVGEDTSRSISLSVRCNGCMTVIHEENCYSGQLRFLDGLPETIKEDKIYHGFGVRSIRTIAETYNGSVSINADDQVFSLTVLLSP